MILLADITVSSSMQLKGYTEDTLNTIQYVLLNAGRGFF